VYVAYNRIHGAKKYFHDGGAIYNLSASPGTVIAENYIFDNDGRIGIYLDEGSRYITVRDNVIADPKGTWLNANTISNALPVRVTLDNTAAGNWHDGTAVGGLWDAYHNNRILEDHLVAGEDWPTCARAVMSRAGIEASAGPVEYPPKKSP
jgi:Right handed beta helix region